MTCRIRSATQVFPLVTLVALAASVFLTGAAAAAPPSASYSFDLVATLPSPAAGLPGMYHTRDFELGGFNDSGTGFWGSDFYTSPAMWPATPSGEGLWMSRPGAPNRLIAYSGGVDPEGVTYSDGFPGPVSVNDAGNGAFAFRLLPQLGPGSLIYLNAGVYRYERAHDVVSTIAKTGSPEPAGGTFAGFYFGTSINSRGTVAFDGIVENPTYGTYVNPLDGKRYGAGIYSADSRGTISSVVVPGDDAPNGYKFDNLRNPWLNDRGDVAFGGHTTAPVEAPCTSFGCSESIYVRNSENGSLTSIAFRGTPAPIPGPTQYFAYAFGPRINNQGDVVFVGCTTTSLSVSCGNNRGVYLYRDGTVYAIAHPGQTFQADGVSFTAERASNVVNNYYVNDAGKVVFALRYYADTNGDSINDSGVFTWDDGDYHVVARTGDSIPGVGTFAHASQPVNVNTARAPAGYSLINNGGHVLLQATLSDGTGALLRANP